MNLNTLISKIFNNKTKHTMEEVKTKMCTHCKRVLPVSMFNKRSDNKTDGLQYVCKECNSKLSKEYNERKKAKKEEANNAAKKLPVSAERIVLKDGTVLKKKEQIAAEPSIVSLADFSNRAILEELKTRGYVWEDMWIKVKIDYDKI